MKTDTAPLYKKLNNQRTQGKWKVSKDKCDIETADSACLGIATMYATETSEANAQYIALAVNNLNEIAEALQLLANEINLSKLNIRKDFSLINAHANALKALNKIS